MKPLAAIATAPLAGAARSLPGRAAPQPACICCSTPRAPIPQELRKAERDHLHAARARAGDSFAVARIDTGSFSEKDIIAKATFDDRPSAANEQKRRSRRRDRPTSSRRSSPPAYTDITGGLLQAVEFLNEKGAGPQDHPDLLGHEGGPRQGLRARPPADLEGFEVVALNVVKLRTDNVDPRAYLARLEDWQQQACENAGGHWRVINDLDRLDRILG